MSFLCHYNMKNYFKTWPKVTTKVTKIIKINLWEIDIAFLINVKYALVVEFIPNGFVCVVVLA